MYSEKATKFCEISTVDLSYIDKSMVDISQYFGAFSEYLNFMTKFRPKVALSYDGGKEDWKMNCLVLTLFNAKFIDDLCLCEKKKQALTPINTRFI